MSLRLVEIFHQKGEPEDLKFLLEDIPVYEFWADKLPDGRMNVRLLLRARDVDKVVDVFESFFQDKERYRIVVLPVDAAVPREEEDKAEKESTEEPAPSEAQEATEGISVEELYQKISPSAKLSRRFVSLVVISSIVAAIGLLKDDVAVIIGSMVIAPLLGPFVGLSLASVLGDFELMKNSLPTVVTGAAIAVSIGLLAGYFAPSAMAFSHEVLSRSQVDFLFILLAITSGIAGAYSLTQDMPETLVGVMMAVSVLPPLVASGIMLSKHMPVQASAAFIVFLINAVCINLSGVVTFAINGIRPLKVWEAKRAQKALILSIAVWLLSLIILSCAVYLEQRLLARP